jgi:DNA-directed RNA polymerase subunit L
MKTIVVKNIKIEEVNFAKKLAQLNSPENLNLKNSLEYIAYLDNGIDGKDLLPKRSKFRVEFEIAGTCSGFANGIRKCIMGEIPVCSLTMESDGFTTSDRYILSDYLQKNIELIPILQEIDFERAEKWDISLDIINLTDEVINVKSGHLKIYEGKKNIPIESIMSPNISIVELHPAMFIKISGITIVHGVSKIDAARFASVSNTRYEILDMVPLAHNKEEKIPGISSLLSDPTEFRIGYTTYRNVKDPRIIIYGCCDSLSDRIIAFKKELENVKEDSKTKVISYFSTLLDVETRGDFKFFNFKDEARTLPNMISQYCFLLDPNIPFSAPSLIHPSTEIGVVKIKHTNSVKIIQDAMTAILLDVEVLKNSF